MQSTLKKYQMYIDGEFVDSNSKETIQVINPATEEPISEIPRGTKEDVRKAISSSNVAQKSWGKLPAVERGQYLHKIATSIRNKSSLLAETISEEMGKPLNLSEVEVNFTADYIDYMAEWARRYEGEIIQSDRPNENIYLYKKPIGVTAGILPWNFPFFLIARKVAPALVTGNTSVIKPSEESPNNAIKFAEIADEINLPKGVFNLVTGTGSIVGDELARNPEVGLVSITGSFDAGSAVMRAASDNVTKVSLELGGKAPAIVMDDADLDLAVDSIVASRIINTGQVCNCAERVYVHKSIEKEFLEKVSEKIQNSKYGDPLNNNDIDMGPLINQDAVASVDRKVQTAVQEGATIVTGGKTVEGTGYHYEPTVIKDANNNMEIMREEIFGPVLPVGTFETLDEAIDLANDNEYGLTSSLYTQNLDVAMRVSNELKVGETYINRENFENMQGFHAGWGKSGIGGADGKHGVEEYLQTHVVYLQYNQNKNNGVN